MGNDHSSAESDLHLRGNVSASRSTTASKSGTVKYSSSHSRPIAPAAEGSFDQHHNPNVFPREEVIDVVWIFWKDCVDILPRKKQLEVAVLLYTNMFTNIPTLRRLFLRNDLKSQALKYLDMLGWLIRRIKTGDQGSLFSSVQRLGERHASWGVAPEYFQLMLGALHSALSSSFPQTYTLRIKFCMEKVFWAAAYVMTGSSPDFYATNPRVRELELLQDIDRLDVCLSSEIGIEYLQRFLVHSYRGELIDFHLAYKQFRGAINSFERDQIARKVFDMFIAPRGDRCLSECPTDIVAKVEKTMQKCVRRGANVPEQLFDPAHAWVMHSMEEHSWPRFCAIMHSMGDDMVA